MSNTKHTGEFANEMAGRYGCIKEHDKILFSRGYLAAIKETAAPDLLHALQVAVKHIRNIEEKYKPEQPFAIGMYLEAIKKATE